MNRETNLIQQLKDPQTREKAFLTLLDHYQERLYWYIRKIVITHENADDVLQNTFMRIFKNIASFEGRSSLGTWMFRIAHNESLRLLKKENKNRLASLDEINPSYLKDLTQDPYFDGNETKLKLHQIIEQQLTSKQRTVFNMKYFDNLSFRQIAEILEVNENTLKSSYYNAVKIIEEEVKDEQTTF
ncbi:MAG: RNA polymerase sigma factor [Eudoraea sp.]|nr:RNA polymerase sigma factor [Eudoraea sp.]